MLIDATLVRMVLVPATMELLGRTNWWLPRWLDRLVPRLAVERHPAAPGPTGRRPPTSPARPCRRRDRSSVAEHETVSAGR